MAAVLNFGGALLHQGVAKTVASGLIDVKADASAAAQLDMQVMVLSAVVGAIVWNLITWYYGIPSSSSHALVGGLCGAAIMMGGWEMIIWDEVKDGKRIGLLTKVIIPIFLSPLAAYVFGFLLMTLIYNLFAKVHPGRIGGWFRNLQLVSAAAMAGMHGSNDAQKSMGIITMALFATGYLAKNAQGQIDVPSWVILSCAVAMALGTAAGGWRIIKTMGQKIIRLEPVHGFAAETSAASVILIADVFHAPISTTHAISGSIFGVGSAKRLGAVRWTVAQTMVMAWFLTLPASGAVAAITYAALAFLRVGGA
jgi:PiT family inorganic phosphate transporter